MGAVPRWTAPATSPGRRPAKVQSRPENKRTHGGYGREAQGEPTIGLWVQYRLQTRVCRCSPNWGHEKYLATGTPESVVDYAGASGSSNYERCSVAIRRSEQSAPPRFRVR